MIDDTRQTYFDQAIARAVYRSLLIGMVAGIGIGVLLGWLIFV